MGWGGVPHKGPGHENVLECGAVLDLECGGWLHKCRHLARFIGLYIAKAFTVCSISDTDIFFSGN